MLRARPLIERGVLSGLLVCIALIGIRAQDRPNNIALHTSYISEARIYPTPFSPNEILRTDFYDLGGALSYSMQYRRAVSEMIQLGVSAEYAPNSLRSHDSFGTEYVDGYTLYLVEASAFFTLPVSSNRLLIHVGGGIGTAFGEREYSIGGISSSPVSSSPAFGIHVVTGLEYLLSARFSLRAEFRFRDPQITFENRFPQEVISANGYEYRVGTKPFTSRINLNGNAYSLGVGFRF